MLRVVRLLLISLVILSVGCSRDPQVQSKRLVDSGNKFFDKGKFKEASMQYRRAIQKAPKNGEAYYRLGLVSLKLGDLSTAAQSLRRAIDTDPENLDAITKLADIFWLAYASDQNKYKTLLGEVEDLKGKLLKKDPKSFDGLRFSGYIELANKNLDAALAKFKEANAVKPYQPELAMVLVQSLVASNRAEEGEKAARDFIEHQKSYAPMYDQLAVMLLNANRLGEAEQLLRMKVDNNPKQEGFYLQLAGFYMGTKRPQEMEAVLQRLLANPKDFPLANLSVGRFFFRFRDYDRARREYEAGLKANPKEKGSFQKALVELLATQGKAPEARVIVEEVLKDNPKDAQAIEMRSALQLQTGDLNQIQAAINDLQALVTKNPENAVYHYELGRALLAKGQTEQAKTRLEEAVRLRADFIPPKLLISQILATRGEHGKALQIADDILRVDPKNISARLVRSSSLIGMGERERAKAELDDILKTAPNSADARYQLGLVNYTEKNFKQADTIFRQLQDTAPGDNRGLIGIVETQVAQRDFASAVKTMEIQIARDPKRQDFKMALANILVRSEKYDEAIAHFRQLVEQNPRSSDLHTRLAETYRLKGDLNAAIDNFRKASSLNPNDPVPMIRLAMLLDGIGRRNEAKPLYEQILRVRPDEPVALNNLAYIKAEEGTDLDQALTLARRARQAWPQDPNIADTLGWVFIKKNLSEDAIKIFKELVEKEPKNATYRFHLAMALFQKGDRPNAKKELQTALQNNPTKDEAGKIQDLIQKIG